MNQNFEKYFQTGLNMIALGINNKLPVEKNWTENHVEEWEVSEYEGNLGFCLGARHFIIDVDPRNGGDESILRLIRDLNLNIKPTVHTAGGGQHYYMTIPREFHGRDFRKELPQYGGIDFLTKGRFVVAAGSQIDGKEYTFEDDLSFVEAPSHLLNLLVKVEVSEEDALEAAIVRDELSQIPESEVREWLFKLDADTNYDRWKDIGMAIQSWDSGERGLALLHEWSKQSVKYKAAEVDYKWRKGYNPDGGITVRSLIHFAQESDFTEKEKQLNEVMTKIKLAVDKQTLQFELPKLVRKMDLAPIDLEQVVKTVQAKFKEVNGGVTIPISAVRELFKPKTNASNGVEVIEAPEWCKKWIYVNARGTYLNLDQAIQYKAEGFNLINGKYIPQGENGGKQSAAKYCADNGFLNVVDDTMYLPQLLDMDNPNPFVEYQGRILYNSYNPRLIPKAVDELDEYAHVLIERVENHVKLICNGDEKLAKIILEWMAYQVQYTGKKILWSPVIQSIQGLGKSFIGDLLVEVMGAQNVGIVLPAQVKSNFNSWACDVAVNVLNELRIQGANRYDIENSLKPLITDPLIQINEKGIKQLTKLNVTNYICFTNYRDALPITETDRRWFVIFNEIENLEELEKVVGRPLNDYFDDLNEAKHNPERMRRWLLDYPISKEFLALKRAPSTDFKKAMIGAEHAAVLGYVETIEVIKRGETKFVLPDIVSAFHLFEAVQELYPDIIMTTHDKNRVLKKLGFLQHQVRITLDGKKSQIWSKKRVTDVAIKRLRETRDPIEDELSDF